MMNIPEPPPPVPALCDLCLRPTDPTIEMGLTIRGEYCKSCSIQVREFYRQIDNLQELLAEQWREGLADIVLAFHHDKRGRVPEFSWIK